MSETGRKMDVEDVLSSIRRLVSEEARTASDTANNTKDTPESDAALLQQGNAAERDKLVLTPSLRVAESASPAPAASEIEQRIADIESLVMSEAVEHANDEVIQNVDVQDIEDIAPENPDDTADFAEMVEDISAQVSQEATADATSEMMSALHLSMKDFARAEPPVTANLSGAPLHDDPVDDHMDDDADGDVETAFDADPSTFDAPLDAAEPDQSVDNSIFPSDSPFEADLDEVPPQPDFMQGMQDDAVELDDTPQDEPTVAPVRDTIITREPPLRSPEPELAAAAASDALFEEPMDYTDQDSFLDEETLREMVSEMVRSELQGELGDRITRNVRKLVRREIHRALASRDFE